MRLKAELSFMYEDVEKSIEGEFHAHCDNPHFSFRGTKGEHFCFLRLNGEWMRDINVQPKWPAAFKYAFYQSLEDAFQKAYADPENSEFASRASNYTPKKWKVSLAFEYFNQIASLQGEFYKAGDMPNFSFVAKNGTEHNYQRRFERWFNSDRIKPKWSQIFTDTLCSCIELQFTRLYNADPEFREFFPPPKFQN